MDGKVEWKVIYDGPNVDGDRIVIEEEVGGWRMLVDTACVFTDLFHKVEDDGEA